jgi:hypothetical protein
MRKKAFLPLGGNTLSGLYRPWIHHVWPNGRLRTRRLQVICLTELATFRRKIARSE